MNSQVLVRNEAIGVPRYAGHIRIQNVLSREQDDGPVAEWFQSPKPEIIRSKYRKRLCPVSALLAMRDRSKSTRPLRTTVAKPKECYRSMLTVLLAGHGKRCLWISLSPLRIIANPQPLVTTDLSFPYDPHQTSWEDWVKCNSTRREVLRHNMPAFKVRLALRHVMPSLR